LSDETGIVTDLYIYDAFGEVLQKIGDTENSYLFTGEQFDNQLSEYYLRARYYDFSIGRFTQMDTWIGDRGRPITLNKYLYADVNPVTNIDPSGHYSINELSVANNIQSSLNSLATRGTYLLRAIDTFQAVSGFFDLIAAVRQVMGQSTSINLNSQNYSLLPNVNFQDAIESATYNFPKAIGIGIGNWSKGYATTKQKHGANSLKGFLLYMPLAVAGLPSVAIPTPAKIKFGNVKVGIDLVFGSSNSNASGQLFGIGIDMAKKRQLVRMDYHTFNTGHGGASGVKLNEISVIRDGNFHYHVLKW
jgi:RHS repeat-associated protein